MTNTQELKRYDIFIDGFERYWDYEQSPEGDWVRYEEVQSHIAKVKADAVREAANQVYSRGFGGLGCFYEYADKLQWDCDSTSSSGRKDK